MTQDNPAMALYFILKKVVDSGGKTVDAGWQSALGSTPSDKNFPRKHAEVVNLFAGTQSYLLSLPEGQVDREIYGKYLPSWYNAVVFRKPWDNNQYPARAIITAAELDQLGGLGSLLGRTERAVLDDTSMEKLKKGLAKWRELLDESGISKDIKEQIKAQVDHITWLLENIETFGPNPVVREARSLVGLGFQLLSQPSSAMTKIAGAVTLLGIFLGGLHTGIDNVAGILEGINEVQVQYELLSNPVLEIEGAPQESPNHDEEILDAEVVDDQQLPDE